LARGADFASTFSVYMFLLLKDLLAKFIITCTLKNKLTTWLCFVEGYLASLHDLVSFKIEQRYALD
jgi:hypothetical protein